MSFFVNLRDCAAFSRLYVMLSTYHHIPADSVKGSDDSIGSSTIHVHCWRLLLISITK